MTAELIVTIAVATILFIVQIGLWRTFRSEMGELRGEVKDLRYHVARIENVLFDDAGPGPNPRD